MFLTHLPYPSLSLYTVSMSRAFYHVVLVPNVTPTQQQSQWKKDVNPIRRKCHEIKYVKLKMP
jgi:hypothetical protein